MSATSRSGSRATSRLPRRSVAAVGLAAAVVAAAGAIGLAAPDGTPSAAAAPALRTFGTCAEVDDWLAQRWTEQTGGAKSGRADNLAGPAAGASVERSTVAAAGSVAADATGAVGSSGTGTNTQEAGVDEADGVKARDGLLYTVDAAGLRVLDVRGAAPALLATLPLSISRTGAHDSIAPSESPELLLVGQRVAVFTTTFTPPTTAPTTVPPTTVPPSAAAPRDFSITRATVVDVADPRSPKLLTSIETPGRTIAAREHGGLIRWVTSSLTRPQGLDCTRIAHPQEPSGAGLLAVRSLDPAKTRAGEPGSPIADAAGVTAAGEMVYASADRLYVATTAGGWWGPIRPAIGGVADIGPAPGDAGPNTWIHAFDTAPGSPLRHVASGQVEGILLSRWSMSERDRRLRVATTRSLPAAPSVPGPGSQGALPAPVTSDAAVSVLVEDGGTLRQVGRATGLGKGERVKSVRWFDDLGVVVTFRQTDPLYVLDLADPTRPAVRGELKVPGFSTYLHPIGDHRLLGVGMTATDQGRITGAQVATFDIADAARPARLDVAEAPGSRADLTYDARAFAYLPAARTALVPGFWSASEAPGPFAPAVRGFTVDSGGRLTVIGTVTGTGLRGGPLRQVTISPTRVALVAGGGGAPATLEVLDVAGGTLNATGTLTLPSQPR